jgi:hypothetical protein
LHFSDSGLRDLAKFCVLAVLIRNDLTVYGKFAVSIELIAVLSAIPKLKSPLWKPKKLIPCAAGLNFFILTEQIIVNIINLILDFIKNIFN